MPRLHRRSSETTPLLWAAQSNARNERLYEDRFITQNKPPPSESLGKDSHAQFCALVGIPPSNGPEGSKSKPHVSPNSLYGRATRQLRSQGRAYNFSASLSNTLLLSQVVLGAALTALGASASSHILITVFGATNTVIAGLVAYLKSRGQPMRSRMYRDDLERVVDEIENSEIMWLGISSDVHGYDEIDTDSEVTVRSEVARLTRLYDRAVRNNTLNNPDMYMAGSFGGSDGGLRNRQIGTQPNVPITMPVEPPAPVPAPVTGTANGGSAAPAPSAPAAAPASDPDQSPASAPSKPKEEKKEEPAAKKEDPPAKDETPKAEDKGKAPEATKPAETPAPATPAPPVQPPAPAQSAQPQPPTADPDASPATAATIKRKKEKDVDDKPRKVEGDEDDGPSAGRS